MPVALNLQVLSLLIGIVAIPRVVTLIGVYVSRRFFNRIDSLAADTDEVFDRIAELETSAQAVQVNAISAAFPLSFSVSRSR